MMIVVSSVVVFLFGMCLLIIAVYGLHHAWFVFFALRRRKAPDVGSLQEFPPVSVQITIYNEGEVIEQTIEAVSRLDYPRNQLQIQLCDDSTDGVTSDICRSWTETLREKGYQIQHLQRPDRQHHKTGNLNHALHHATGEYLVLVDADFKLPADFLQKNLPIFLADDRVGAVQSFWTHENRTDHWLARTIQASYDFHLQLEQVTRSNYDWWNEFNGSGGIWRRKVIEEVGGWPVAAVEDVLLSVLAQERGWKIKFSMLTTCMGLLPDSADGYRSQQNRWALGCGEVLRQKFGDLMRMPQSWLFKMESMFHIGGYFVYVAMTGIMLLTLPMLWIMMMYPSLAWMQWLPPLALLCAVGGSSISFWEANRRIGGHALYQAIRPQLAALEQSAKASTATIRFLMGLFGMTLRTWQSTNSKFRGIRYLWDKLFEVGLLVSVGGAVWLSIKMGYYSFALPAVIYSMGVLFLLLSPLFLPGGPLFRGRHKQDIVMASSPTSVQQHL